MDGIAYPFGKATVETLGDAATYNVTIADRLTVLKRTGGLSQAVTGLSLTASKDLPDGAEVVVDIAQGATGRNVAFGSAGSTIVAPALVGDASDRDTITLRWDKAAKVFTAKTAWQKILAA
jgi:hypothetical protein